MEAVSGRTSRTTTASVRQLEVQAGGPDNGDGDARDETEGNTSDDVLDEEKVEISRCDVGGDDGVVVEGGADGVDDDDAADGDECGRL